MFASTKITACLNALHGSEEEVFMQSFGEQLSARKRGVVVLRKQCFTTIFFNFCNICHIVIIKKA